MQSANFGKAWGISLRLHRVGVSKKAKFDPDKLPQV